MWCREKDTSLTWHARLVWASLLCKNTFPPSLLQLIVCTLSVYTHLYTDSTCTLDTLSLSLSFATNWFVLIFMTCICFAGLKTLDCLLPSFSLCVCAIVCAVAFKAPTKRRFFTLYLCPCLSFFICLYLFRAALRVLTERKRVLRESSGCYRLYYYKHRLD